MEAGSIKMRMEIVKDFLDRSEIEIKTGPFGTQLKAAEYQSSGTPVLNVKNLGFSTINAEKLDKVGAETVERLKVHLLKAGDIVFGRKGAVERHAFISVNEEGWMQGSDCIRLRVKTDMINPHFLSYYFLTKEHRAFMVSMCSHGTTMASLNQKILEQMCFPMPQRNIQDKIVGILERIDRKIELNNRINDNLQQQAQAIYRERYEGVFSNDLPYGWRIVTLGDVATISNKSFNPLKEPEMTLEHYSIPAFDEARFPVFEPSTSIKSNKFIIDASCFMISKLNPTTKRVWKPFCLTENAVCSTEFIVYKAKDKSITDFLYSVIDSSSFSDFMCSHVTGSTGSRQRTTPSETLSYELILPSEDELAEFQSLVSPMYAQMRINAIENDKLKRLRDSLLPKLMSGEIDVSDIQI